MSTTSFAPSEAPPVGLLSSLRSDIPAGVVVFLVATPLCLGIAQASGAPLLSGLVAGVVGGLVVSPLSRSTLSVSGPAAGLAVLVATGIRAVGFRAFLAATLLAGALQIALGLLRLGAIAHFFPNAVLKGMLAAIGVLIVLKQVPHALGHDRDYLGDLAFAQPDGLNTFSALAQAARAVSPAVCAVTALCALAYAMWPRVQRGVLRHVPPALVVVALGALLVPLLQRMGVGASLGPEHLVALPVFASPAEVLDAAVTPDLSALARVEVLQLSLTLCAVASLETLLSIEAIDRLDPQRRISPPNRELVAQGVGNMVSALLGGLPVTSVIVRSSANVHAGGKTRTSAMVHGLLLLVGTLALPSLLNRVPLAALAVVLLVVGTKLAAPSVFRHMWRLGPTQFVPFAVTIAAVVLIDLLRGTMIGLVMGLFFAVRRQQRNAVVVDVRGDAVTVRFAKDMTFLQKARVKEVLQGITPGATVVIDRSRIDFVDDDVEEVLVEFSAGATARGITVTEHLSADLAHRARLRGTGH